MRLKIRQMIKLMSLGFIGLALLSCSKGDSEPGYQKPIVLSGYTARSVTKANGSFVTGKSLPSGQAFGVYVYNTGTEPTFDPAKVNATQDAYVKFMSDVAVTYEVGELTGDEPQDYDPSKDPGKYTYSPLRYWPNSDGSNYLAFFAYYPYRGNGITQTGFGNFSFTVQALPANQVDFMLSDVVPGQEYGSTNAGTDVVRMNFSHMLTQVRFTGISDAPSGAAIKVTSLKVEDVINAGTLAPNPTATSSTWTVGTSTATYNLTPKEINLPSTTVDPEAEPVAIVDDSQTLLMVPQTLSDDAKLKIEYTITTTITDPETQTQSQRVITQTQEVSLKTLIEKWERNKQIVYKLSFGIHPIEFSASVSGWTDDSYIVVVQ